MRTRAILAIPIALLLGTACSDTEPTESMADRCAQVEGAIDALVLDVGNHMAEVGAAGELAQVFTVERRHYTRTVRDLDNVADWLRTMDACTDDDGAVADTAALRHTRATGQVVAAIHKQIMLAAPDLATAQREETRYQMAMLDVAYALRRDMVDLDMVAPEFACLPLEAPDVAPAPELLRPNDMAPEAAPAATASAPDVLMTDRHAPLEGVMRPVRTDLTPVDNNPVQGKSLRIPVGPKVPAPPTPDEMAPETPPGSAPAPEWLTPGEVGPPIDAVQRAPHELVVTDNAPTADTHIPVGPMWNHEPTPTKMAPIPLGE